ncbi:terminase small subunit [Pseudanabaena phage Pan3]|nr:terminase small subunit [Pseudanabaena phage Pan3]
MSDEPWFPEGYGQETADAICERIADGESLRSICRDEEMPSTSTVCKWLGKSADFAEQYARARELQADALFDDILDIADKGLKALDSPEDRRIQIDARKWMAGKLRGKYSDKVKHVGGDSDDAPIQIATKAVDLTDEQLAAIASGVV